jgi:hypothetical protein
MPRCPTHCPPGNNGPFLAAAILAGAVALIAARAVIMHVLIVLVITLGIVSGLGASALAVLIVMRLRSIARKPLAPSRKLRAHAEILSTFPAADADRRQITAGRTALPGRPPVCESRHHSAPAIERRQHHHARGSHDEQDARATYQTPGRMPGAQQLSPRRRDREGHRRA